MLVDEIVLGRLLEALDSAGSSTTSGLPRVEGVGDDVLMQAANELLARSWISAEFERNGRGQLFFVQGARITDTGRSALTEIRRKFRGQDPDMASAGGLSTLERKRQRRLEYMQALYDETGGSTNVAVDMWELGDQLGWSREDTDHTVEYLGEEGLLETVAMGGTICITHQGVVEVEASISRPNDATEHFPARNVINVGTMIASQIQQDSAGATQTTQVIAADSAQELLEVIRQLRSEVLPELELGKDDAETLKTELEVAELYLRSNRPRRAAVRQSIEQVSVLLGQATVVVGSSLQLVEWTAKLAEYLSAL